LAQFSYKAVDTQGGVTNGTIEAVQRRSAISALTQKGFFVTELAEVDSEAAGKVDVKEKVDLFRSFGSKTVSGKDLLAMTSQLSTALRAGLSLLEALKIITDQQHKPTLRKLLESLAEAVSGGESLSDAMTTHPQVFSQLYISMIRVGETAGILDQTMGQLTGLLAREEKVKANIKNASVYPMLVLCVGLASVVIVVTFILPKIFDTVSMGVDVMPWPTRVLLGMSEFFMHFGWLVICAIVAGVYSFKKWSRTAGGKLRWDSFKLKVPVFGSVLRSIAVGRFARTLGALTKGGITILEALAVVRDTLGNELLAREIDSVAEQVKSGAPLAAPLADSGHFPPLLVQIVSVGENTGKLDELLLNAAETFDDEADAAVTKFMAIFPAVLIILLALVIGFIIAATLLPIIIMELGGGVV